jgi:hypothetical protein
MKSGPGDSCVDSAAGLITLWLVNAGLALSGVAYYGALWLPAYTVCQDKGVRANEGVLRVCRRRIFRYTSRMGLKLLLTIYCAIRIHIILRQAGDVHEDQWAGAVVIMLVLLWLTVDTILARRYD